MYLLKNLRKFKTKNEKVSRNFKPQLHMVRENDPKKNFPRFTVYVIFYLFIFFQLNRVNKMCVIQIISFFSRNNFDFFFFFSFKPPPLFFETETKINLFVVHNENRFTVRRWLMSDLKSFNLSRVPLRKTLHHSSFNESMKLEISLK
jgi:hypothetical protein